MTDRKVVIPGEIIEHGDDFLPGEGTEKKGKDIIALKYGLAEEANKLVKVIALSGVYQPRRGNVVIGKVENVTFNGWVLDIGTAENAFLSLTEVPRYVNKDAMEEVMEIGDMVVAKVWGINRKGIDLTIKSRTLGRLEDGIVIRINPNKVPRVIGKEGSMVNLIKDETKCDITVGQNGLIWIKGSRIEDEIFAKKAIEFIVENTTSDGLTDKVETWLKENGGKN